jgi:hypothetical protein
MVEPKDKSGNFSNLVIQEQNGTKHMFTVRYFNSIATSRTTTESISDVQMRYGINSFDEPWEDEDGGGSSGGGSTCGDYVETLQDCTHPEHQEDHLYADCTHPEVVLVWEDADCVDNGSGNTGDTGNDSSNGGSGGTSSSNDGNEPTDVVSSPVNPDDADFNIISECVTDSSGLSQLTSGQRAEIADFIEKNGCSDGNALFIEEAIDILNNDGEVDFNRKIIIESSVPNCVENILNDIISDNTYIDLGDMPNEVKQELNLSGYIMDLFNNSDKFALIFNSQSLTSTDQNGNIIYKNAQTDIRIDPNNRGNFIFTITIDPSYISNATDLAIARTIIHESVHAFISYKYQTDIFSDLSQSLTHLLSQAGGDPNTAQHMLMSTDFVEAIANSLGSWDNNTLPNEYYDYLSWSGAMLNTSAFNSLSASFKTNVENANLAEGNAGPNGAYDINNAKGIKNCN